MNHNFRKSRICDVNPAGTGGAAATGDSRAKGGAR
jgi:hypothetical protein